MNTNTPKRVEGDDTNSLESTPFRKKALQEQRLKEELLLSATPGWGKRTYERHVDTFSRDPSEVKGYLRDLSSVLVSQGRNLTGSLVDRATSVEQASSKDEGKIEIKASSEVPAADPPLVQKSQKYITDLVFSRLESTTQKPKIRKIHGLVIRDMETSSAQDRRHSTERRFSESLKSSFTAEQNGNVLQQDGISQEQLVDNGMELTSQIEPDNQVEVIRQVERTPQVTSPQSLESLESDQDSTELEPESIDPLGLVYLKHCLNQFMNENDIKLGEGSWRSLQDASITLVEKLVVHFTEEKSQKIVLDRQNILKMLEKYELIPPSATNDDIFEMCCRYLPLESLNKLELALFF